jgi:hypothetical protein
VGGIAVTSILVAGRSSGRVQEAVVDRIILALRYADPNLTVTTVAGISDLRVRQDRYEAAILHGDVPLDLADAIIASRLGFTYLVTKGPRSGRATGDRGVVGEEADTSAWFPIGLCLSGAQSAIVPSRSLEQRLRQELDLPCPSQRCLMTAKAFADLPGASAGAALILLSDTVSEAIAPGIAGALRRWPAPLAIRNLAAFLEGDRDAEAFLDINPDARVVCVHGGERPSLAEEIDISMAFAVATRHAPRRFGSLAAARPGNALEALLEAPAPPQHIAADDLARFIRMQVQASASGGTSASGAELALIADALRIDATTPFVQINTALPRLRHPTPQPFHPDPPADASPRRSFAEWSRHFLTGLPLPPDGRQLRQRLEEQVQAAERLIEEWGFHGMSSAARRDFIGAGLNRIDELEKLIKMRDSQLVSLNAELHTSRSMIEYLEQKMGSVASEQVAGGAGPEETWRAVRASNESLR